MLRYGGGHVVISVKTWSCKNRENLDLQISEHVLLVNFEDRFMNLQLDLLVR